MFFSQQALRRLTRSATQVKSFVLSTRTQPHLRLPRSPSRAPPTLSPAAHISTSRPRCGQSEESAKTKESTSPESATVVEEQEGSPSLRVRFRDGSSHDFPVCWLRDNCQCDGCYDHKSFTRKLVLEDWDQDDCPEHVEVEAEGVTLRWKSGHHSHFEGRWLRERSFTTSSRDVQRDFLALKKELWGPDFTVDAFNYEDLVRDDAVLLQWLLALERRGITLIRNTPREPKACFNIVERVGFVKPTHYGVHYPIRNKAGANSLAYTDSKLGMHNDLPYYQYVPGIIFLHCITQFTGAGGENDIADGFFVADYLRRHYPDEYEVLTRTPVYFWNKGSALVAQETTEFHKLLNIPLIVVNKDGVVVRVNNSQLRDSYLDLPPERVSPWYRAMRLYNRVMEELSIRLKLNDGETLVMDNTRLLHGRTAYEGGRGERYMDQTYLDWDEALSKRRVLQEKLGGRVE